MARKECCSILYTFGSAKARSGCALPRWLERVILRLKEGWPAWQLEERGARTRHPVAIRRLRQTYGSTCVDFTAQPHHLRPQLPSFTANSARPCPETLSRYSARASGAIRYPDVGPSDKFGESPWNFNWDHTNRVTVDLLELIDGFANEPVILCGLSMGSAIAAQFATLHPDKVRKLVLVSAWGGETFPRDPAQMQLLESLSSRTLMIAGGSDTQSLNEFSYASQNGYTARLFVIDGAGYYVNETNPDAFNAALSQFISAE